MSRIYTLDARKVKIDSDKLLRSLGYPSSEAVSDKVRDSLPDLMEKTVERAEPKAIASLESVKNIRSDTIQILDGPAFHGRLLAKAAEPASKVALFALTIGQKITDWIDELFAEDAWAGFIADAIASELIEALADQFQNDLAIKVKPQNLFCGLRYSPGYCDWNIEELPLLLSKIGAENIGISLTQGCMMVPKKSIAGLIGFGKNPKTIRFNPCEMCSKKDCSHRRLVKKTEEGRKNAPYR